MTDRKKESDPMQQVLDSLFAFNEDELFYKEYYQAGKDSASLKAFLEKVDQEDAVRRHLIIPELLPEIISYEMDDSEYFQEGDGKNVLISRHNRYTPAFLHRHDFFEIIFVYSGHCTQNISLDRIEFQEGDLIFVAPGIYHTMEVFDDDSVILNILLRKGTFYQMFSPLMHGHSLISQFFSEGLYHAEQIKYLVFHKGLKDLDGAKERVLALWREQTEYDLFSDQMLIGQLITFIARSMRNDQDVMESSVLESRTAGRDDFRVLRYMQDNLATVTLSDVAEHFGFSIAHTSRLIKSSTGQGFNEWKRTMRLRRAQQLLLNTKTPVADISEQLGYENPESFIRSFKKEVRVTPAKYRKQGAEQKGPLSDDL